MVSTLDANMVVKPGDMVTMTVTGANDRMQISLNDSIVSVASSNANSVTFMIPTEIDEGEFEASLMTGTDKIRLGTHGTTYLEVQLILFRRCSETSRCECGGNIQ